MASFVVSVVPIVGAHGEVYQPVIHVVEEGLRLEFRTVLHSDDSVRIDYDLTLTHIGDVDTFTFLGEYPDLRLPIRTSRRRSSLAFLFSFPTSKQPVCAAPCCLLARR